MIFELRRKIIATNVGKKFFWIGFFIELFIVAINMGEVNLPYEKRFFQLACLLFCIKIAFTKYSKREWIVILIFGILGVISYFHTNDMLFVRVAAMVFAAKNISSKTALKSLMIVMSVAVIVFGVLSITGIFGGLEYTYDYGRGGAETRYCFGLKHANLFHGNMWIIMLLALYLCFEKLKWYHFVFLSFANIGVFYLSASRTGVIMGFVVILLTAFARYCKKLRDKKVFYILGAISLVGAITFSLLVAYYGTSIEAFAKLDAILTYRITYCYNAVWKGNGLFLFSGLNNRVETEFGYISILFTFGIIFFISYIGACLLLIRKCYLNHEYMRYVMVLAFVIVTTIDVYGFLVYIARDVILLLLFGNWNLLLDKKRLEIVNVEKR